MERHHHIPSEPPIPPGQEKLFRWGTLAFAGISLVAAAIILRVTEPDLAALAARFHPVSLVLLLLSVGGCWLADYLRLRSLASVLGERVGLRLGLESTFIGYLFSALTPFEGGGGPMQVVWLRIHGISTAHGSAIVMVKAVMAVVSVAIAGLAVFFLYPELLAGTPLKGLFVGVGVIMFFYLLFVLGSVFAPRLVKKGITAALDRFTRTRWAVGRKIGHWEHHALDWVDRYHRAVLTFLSAGKWALAACFFWTLVFLTLLFATGPLAFATLGIDVPFGESMKGMTLLHFMMYYMPTPGAAGIGEGGFFLLFSKWTEASHLGMATILWRALSTYLGVGIGAWIFTAHTGRWAGKKLLTLLRHPRQGR